MTRTEVVISVLTIIVLIFTLVCGCSNNPGITTYVVVKKLDDGYVRICSVRGKQMNMYVGSEWNKTRVGYTFEGPAIAGKYPVWIDGKVKWFTY